MDFKLNFWLRVMNLGITQLLIELKTKLNEIQ